MIAAVGLTALAALAQQAPAETASATALRPYLTQDAAAAGIQACLAYARREDLRVAVAVRDRGGNLVAFTRMDDVFVKQAELARIKAETAATTPASTARIGDLAYAADSPLRGLELVPGVTPVEGGEPITLSTGDAIGGVGVSGASPAQDGACARLAVQAIRRASEE